MDSSLQLQPPSWITQPAKLLRALEFSEYYNDSFDNTTSHIDPAVFRTHITQFLYWKRQLASSLTPRTIIFSLLGKGGLESLNIPDVISEASKVCDLRGAFEFYQAANPKFIGISFEQNIDHQEFANHFKFYKDTIVAYISPSSDNSRAFSLLWLPPLFNIHRVRTMLSHYCKHISLQHGTTKIAPGKYIQSSTVRGTLTLKDGYSFEQLPHLISLPSPHLGHALLIIQGHSPFCLKCLHHGHLCKDCTIPKCSACSFFHSSSDICHKISYAQRVSNSSPASDTYSWSDDVVGEEEAIITDHPSPSYDALSTQSPIINQVIPALPTLSSSEQSMLHHSHTTTSTNKPHPPCSPATLLLPVQPITIPIKEITNHDISISPHSSEKRRKTHQLTSHHSSSSDSHKVSLLDSLTTSDDSSEPLMTYARKPSASRSKLSSLSDHTSDAPRSLILPFTPFHQTFSDSDLPDLPPLAHTEDSSLFMPTETSYYHSGSEDSSSDSHMSVDPLDSSETPHRIRKRKGSRPSSQPPIIHTDPDATSSTASSTIASTEHKSTSASPSTDPLDPPTFLELSSHSSSNISTFTSQLTSIMHITPDQASSLIELCPNHKITSDNVKSIKLLFSHGISYFQLIDQPHILNLRFTTLNKKVKHLQRSLGTFTIQDICNESRLQDKELAGDTVTPTGFFSTD